MDFIREIQKVEGNSVTVRLPENYRFKEVEVLILPFKEIEESEHDHHSRSFESLKLISIDTRNFKFNREELYDR
ncbi:MAG: hypothetical protein ACM3SY_12755 [Candidatus Omnitrophota bacterium]